MIFTGVIGATYQLDPKAIASGGEGSIHNVLGMDSQIAKVYNLDVLTAELEEKLTIMLEYPPDEVVMSQVAWPIDILCGADGRCYGFVMAKLNINAELGEIYKYPATLPFSVQQKVNIAQNICVVISEVHKAGYVFGDFNPRNIGLDKDTGLVSFLDTDTYHIVSPVGGKIYRCAVCAPGYAAPELLSKCSDFIAANPSASKHAYAQTPLPTFTQETDNFALAIHIFKLLMNGYTPFGGIIETSRVSQAAPGVGDAAVRRDSYCFKPGMKPQSVAIPVLEAFPKEITDLYARAFIEGKHDPTKRPTATEWHSALLEFEKSLVTCANDNLHQYHKSNAACPLCAADERFAEAVGLRPAAPIAPPVLTQTLYRQPPPPVATPVSVPIARTPAPVPTVRPQSAPPATAQKPKKSALVGDIVQFGWCDWRVLDVDGDHALILAGKATENRSYHAGGGAVTWETSSMRRFLNGEFYNSFSQADQARIRKSTIVNIKSQLYGTSGGKGTTDKIFLLSIEEVVKYFGDSGQLNNMRKSKTWWISDIYNATRTVKTAEGVAWRWWLRSPGNYPDSVAYVTDDGRISMKGNTVSYYGGVRPALWLKL